MFSNPIALALMSCLAYGIGGPMMKKAFGLGANANGLIFVYGLVCMAVAVFNALVLGKAFAVGGTGSSLWLVLTCLVVAWGFERTLVAFTQAQILMSTGAVFTGIIALTAMYPIVTAIIEFGFMEVSKKVSLPLIGLGAILTIAGGIIVSLGMNPPWK